MKIEDMEIQRSRIEPGIRWKAEEIGLNFKQNISRKKLRKSYRRAFRKWNPYADWDSNEI